MDESETLTSVSEKPSFDHGAETSLGSISAPQPSDYLCISQDMRDHAEAKKTYEGLEYDASDSEIEYLLYPEYNELKQRISQVSTGPNSLLNATNSASYHKVTANSSSDQKSGSDLTNVSEYGAGTKHSCSSTMEQLLVLLLMRIFCVSQKWQRKEF